MGTVNEAEFPDWTTSGDNLAAFVALLQRHVDAQTQAIVAALPTKRLDPEFMRLAQGYQAFFEDEFYGLVRDVAGASWVGVSPASILDSSLANRARRAAATHNSYVSRFRRLGVEPVLPDSEAPPGADSWGWKPWALGGLAVAGVFAIGYLLMSASKAKSAFGVQGMPEIQAFRGARHALPSGTRGRKQQRARALRGYNLEVEPQHR